MTPQKNNCGFKKLAKTTVSINITQIHGNVLTYDVRVLFKLGFS